MANLPDITIDTTEHFIQPLVLTVDGGITWDALEVIEYGQGFNIGFALKNAGDVSAENVPVRILINDEVVIDKTLEMLNACGRYNYNYGTYFLEPGEYTIKYILDPDNVIEESDENNNTFTYSLRVENNGKILPDLAVTTPSDSPQPLVISTDGGTSWIAPAVVEQGTTFMIGYGISNTGAINAENVLYQVKVNDTIILEHTLDKVYRYGSYFYCYGIYGFDPGEYTISITLDPYNTIPEANKDNNSFSYTLSVPGNQNWLVKNRWASEPLMGTDITLIEYFPIDPQTGLQYDTNCGITGNTVVAAYYASIGYDFAVELTPEDAFYFNGILYIDGTEANAQKYGTLSFAEINKRLADFDVNSAEDVAVLSLATAVLLYEHPADYSFKRLGFKSAESSYRGNSVFWTSDGKLSDAGWEMLIRNIQAKRPVITGVPDPHVIIIDGYDAETDKMHIYFNFGVANGKGYVEEFGNYRGNGWYSREECNALELTFFTYDIIPDTEAPVAGDITCQINRDVAQLSLDFADDVGVWKRYYRTADDFEWKEYTDDVKIERNATIYFKACDKAKNFSAEKSFTVTELPTVTPQDLYGTSNGCRWQNTSDTDKYTVEISKNNFSQSIKFNTVKSQVDFYGIPSGNWQWRVGITGTTDMTEGNVITAPESQDLHCLSSISNGAADLFFANAQGTWEAKYAAQHAGLLNGWSGTNEQVMLNGKNKLADIFEGSSDANILVMTDDANGDALFVDDIYTALPGTVAEQQARIVQIDEIRAGLGDDIVDMTSQKFAYVSDGVTIYGGAGNDTIWANNGSNTLFGDAGNDHIVGGADSDVIIGGIGNDTLHGGGGNDIFCFGENWGNDTVEQLAAGKVTLWFEDGGISNWNADTLTYTDGENTVKVSGVSNVTLKFGDNTALPAGCFDNAASENIFENKSKGMLA